MGVDVLDRPALDARWTPDWLARDLVGLADLGGPPKRVGIDKTILVPGYGRGALAHALFDRTDARIVGVELNAELASSVRSPNFWCERADFTTWLWPHRFDRILMNPPRRSTEAFVEVATSRYLKPGGRLVALVHDEAVSSALLRFVPGAQRYLLPPETFMFDSRPLPAAVLVWDAP